MEIRFSRHARRRSKLYGISEKDIIEALKVHKLVPGMNEVLVSMDGVDYPVKIVAIAGDDIITVVTNYPLKKGKQV